MLPCGRGMARVDLGDVTPGLPKDAPPDPAALPDRLADRVLDLAPVGVLVAELREGEPIVYINAAFETITGYGPADALGRNCRYLQGNDRLQPQISELREAIRRREAVSVQIRNYRKDGRL